MKFSTLAVAFFASTALFSVASAAPKGGVRGSAGTKEIQVEATIDNLNAQKGAGDAMDAEVTRKNTVEQKEVENESDDETVLMKKEKKDFSSVQQQQNADAVQQTANEEAKEAATALREAKRAMKKDLTTTGSKWFDGGRLNFPWNFHGFGN